MAIAAIHALNGTYVMRVSLYVCMSDFSFFFLKLIPMLLIVMVILFVKGCDQPLIVRFAAPKKPRVGDSRYHIF